MNKVYLGLGSNIGDRIHHITKAISLLSPKCTILNTSYLYQSKPAYYNQQNMFLNTTMEVKTELEPFDLLKYIKEIELKVGRIATFRNGPRIIDIDILLYNNEVIIDKNLNIPHISITEREFVLIPLADMIPDRMLSFNNCNKTIKSWINNLPEEKINSLDRILPLGSCNKKYENDLCTPGNNIRNKNTRPLLRFGKKTFIMGILNATPDSFSKDGIFNNNTNIDIGIKKANEFINYGADILDIGGCSTRPNSKPVSVETELNRVIPLIDKLTNLNIPISIDTHNIEVARESVNHGAMIINDVSGQESMFKTAAELSVPLVLTTGSLIGSNNPISKLNGIDYINELRNRIDILSIKAIQSGIPRWNLLLDPGLGFEKSFEQNIDIVKNLRDLKCDWPTLVGPSRKGFIGNVLSRENPSDRMAGTAAVIAKCIEQGADVIRVHDVKEMVDVCKMSDILNRI